MNEIFVADPDTPFTCPHDGARTEFVDAKDGQFFERCLECNRIFTFEFDEEDYNE